MPAQTETARPAVPSASFDGALPSAPGEAVVAEPFEALDACHAQIQAMLAQMNELVTHLQTRGLDVQAQQMAGSIFRFFMQTAREHHLDEERHVFPAMIHSGDDELVRHTLRLQQDHGWIEEDWLELAPQLESIAAGYHWFNIELLALAVPVFTALYQDHIALEESLIYPQARARMAQWTVQGMGREMAARRRNRSLT